MVNLGSCGMHFGRVRSGRNGGSIGSESSPERDLCGGRSHALVEMCDLRSGNSFDFCPVSPGGALSHHVESQRCK